MTIMKVLSVKVKCQKGNLTVYMYVSLTVAYALVKCRLSLYCGETSAFFLERLPRKCYAQVTAYYARSKHHLLITICIYTYTVPRLKRALKA